MNKRGFTLVELLVATSIMAGALMLSLAFLDTMSKSTIKCVNIMSQVQKEHSAVNSIYDISNNLETITEVENNHLEGKDSFGTNHIIKLLSGNLYCDDLKVSALNSDKSTLKIDNGDVVANLVFLNGDAYTFKAYTLSISKTFKSVDTPRFKDIYDAKNNNYVVSLFTTRGKITYSIDNGLTWNDYNDFISANAGDLILIRSIDEIDSTVQSKIISHKVGEVVE